MTSLTDLTHTSTQGDMPKQQYPYISEIDMTKLKQSHDFNEIAVLRMFNLEYACLLCKRVFKGGNIFSHIQSKKHIKYVTGELHTKIVKSFIEFWDNHKNHFINKYITWPQSLNQIYCHACQVALDCYSKKCDDHFTSESHLCSETYNNLLKDVRNWTSSNTKIIPFQITDIGKIFKNTDLVKTNLLDVCVVDKLLLESMYPINLLDNLSRTHKEHIINEIRKEQFELENLVNDVKGKSTRRKTTDAEVKYDDYYADIVVQIYKDHYYCLLCYEFVHLSGILNHVSVKQHPRKINDLCCKTSDIYCCLYCHSIFFDFSTFQEHIELSNHIALNLRKEECPSCKMTLFGYKQDIYKHIHFNYENCIMENENNDLLRKVINPNRSRMKKDFDNQINLVHPTNSLAIYRALIHYNCLLCHFSINREENVFNHIKGAKHKHELQNWKKIHLLRPFLDHMEYMQKEDNEFSIYSNQDFLFPSTANAVYCKPCNKQIQAQLKDLNLHFDSSDHINNCNSITIRYIGKKNCDAISSSKHYIKTILNRALEVMPEEVSANANWLYDLRNKIHVMLHDTTNNDKRKNVIASVTANFNNLQVQNVSNDILTNENSYSNQEQIKQQSTLNMEAGQNVIQTDGTNVDQNLIHDILTDEKSLQKTNQKHIEREGSICNKSIENMEYRENLIQANLNNLQTSDQAYVDQSLTHNSSVQNNLKQIELNNRICNTLIENMEHGENLDNSNNCSSIDGTRFFNECIANAWSIVENENKFNKILFKKTTKNVYSCNICNCDITIINNINSINVHLESDLHKDKLKFVDMSYRYYCHPCNSIMQDEIWYKVHKQHSWHKERLALFCKSVNANVDFSEIVCEECGVISFGCENMLPPHIHNIYKFKNLSSRENVFFCLECNRDVYLSPNLAIIHLGENNEDFSVQFTEALENLQSNKIVHYEYIGNKELNQSGSLTIQLECLDEYVNDVAPSITKIHIGIDVIQFWYPGTIYAKLSKDNGNFNLPNMISDIKINQQCFTNNPIWKISEENEVTDRIIID